MSSVNRPLGVSILAVVHVLQALGLFVGGLALFAVGILKPRIFMRMPHFLTGHLSVLGSILFVLALLALLLAYGLWVGKGWAWAFSFIFATLGMLISVVILFIHAGVGSVVTLILDLVIVYYLMQPNVKAFFNRPPSPVQVVPYTVQEPKAAGTNARYCSNCGGPAKQEELYCSHCGAKLT